MPGYDELDAALEQDADEDTFHGRLKRARKERALTQAQLAKLIEKARPTVAAYESGLVPDLDVVRDLAKHLDVDVRYLAFGRGPGFDPYNRAPSRTLPLVSLTGEGEAVTGEAALPESIASRLQLPAQGGKLVQIALSAPSLSIKAGDWAFVDGSDPELRADGALYAVHSNVGAIVVRTTPILVPAMATQQITDGHGRPLGGAYEKVRSVGRVVALLAALDGEAMAQGDPSRSYSSQRIAGLGGRPKVDLRTLKSSLEKPDVSGRGENGSSSEG